MCFIQAAPFRKKNADMIRNSFNPVKCKKELIENTKFDEREWLDKYMFFLKE